MSFTEAVTSCFTNYINFSGRARRSEYWYFFLFSFLVSLVISIINSVILKSNSQVLPSIFSLALFIPSLAVTWRRLHDIGRSGGWYFIGLIPLVGWIILLVWVCTDSEPRDNRFVPCPKIM